ncbi:P-loop containing nucleoside triphosphate hydrolase protein [Cunninghamella echinulata]|nr:P-loop containing nucleoside triphosphate hydrolase protein [Cunninghamella echinulata]
MIINRLDARGFQEDMFNVLEKIKEQKSSRDYQTLLFSATVPESVMETINRFLKPDYTRIDLIGNAKNRTNTNIRHIAMPSSYMARADIIGDVVNVYGKSGLTVIFCATKADANELGTHEKIKQDAAVLHGDIAQQSRESTMKAFREGKYKCIVCTDVLARGLDIPQVDLVINCQPPKDTESYVHRSGRTGRAGRSGVCVTFYKPQEEGLLHYISKKTGVKFETMSAPRPEDIIKATTEDCFKSIDSVNPDVLHYFTESAKQLIEKHGAEEAVASALAFMTGYHKGVPTRSLLTSMENQITLYFNVGRAINHPGYVKNIISREFPSITYEDTKGWRMTKDYTGVVADFVASKVEVKDDGLVYLDGRAWHDDRIEVSAPSQLPELAERENRNQGGGSGYGGGNRGYGGGGYGNKGNNRGGYNRNNGGGGYGRNNNGGRRGGYNNKY